MEGVADPLKVKVLRFQRTGRGWEDILEEVSERIYRYPAQGGSRSEDDAGEFYLFFVSKLKRLILAYRDRGIPFDHYLNSTMRWNLRSYFRTSRMRRQRWSLSASPELWGVCPDHGSDGFRTCEIDPYPGVPPRMPDPVIGTLHIAELAADPVYRRRLLFLFLRGARDVGRREIHWFARLTGYDCLWLEERVLSLREGLEPKEGRLRALRERRNRVFSRCLALETELKRETDPERRGRIACRIARSRRIMTRITEAMARVPLAPTHRAIGEQLGVPKGTVDTGLRWAQRTLPELSADGQLGYA